MTVINKKLSFHLLSDLHLEFIPDFIPDINTNADVIVLAGDIAIGSSGLDWARNVFPDKEIIYVVGNHEFYQHNYHELLNELKDKAKKLGIYFLENEEVIISGVRILGCSLWTDYLASPDLSQTQAKELIQTRLADHRLIKYDKGIFSADDAYYLHSNSIKWLKSKLIDNPYSPTVVITHHGPSLSCVHKQFGHNELSAAFYSDLDGLLGKADIWMYGHTHSNIDKIINGTRLVSNQLGYPSEVVAGFYRSLVIEVN